MAGDSGPIERVVNSVDDCRKAMRQRYKYGSGAQFTEEEIRAIVQIANDGFKVSVHAHGAERMKLVSQIQNNFDPGNFVQVQNRSQ